jgi:uncharacterized protein YhfF
MERTEAVHDFWREFCDANPGVDPREPFQAWHFGNSEDLAHELCELVMQGIKTATAALVWEAEADPDTAPFEGGYSVITDFAGAPRCVIRTTGVGIHPFNEVDAAFAFEEGEGDRSLDHWRQVHWDYFVKRCAELGKDANLQMPVICERFALLFPKNFECEASELKNALRDRDHSDSASLIREDRKR